MQQILRLIPLLVVFASCSPAKLSLDKGEWTERKEYPVKGRGNFIKEKISFDVYHTTIVKRSWVRENTNSFGIGKGNVSESNYSNSIMYQQTDKRQSLKFELSDGTSHATTTTISIFNANSLVIGSRPNSILNLSIDLLQTAGSLPQSTYYVQIALTEQASTWEMLVDKNEARLRPDTYIGYLSLNKDNYYTISPLTRLETKNGRSGSAFFGLVGYEFKNRAGRPVGAVSLIDKGQVYFQTDDMKERFLLANAFTAMLMEGEIEN